MDKEEIIRRLKKISEHAVHVTGEQPFIISLDDGIALNEAVSLLKEQEAVKPISAFKRVNGTMAYSCPRCAALIIDGNYCKHCGQELKWK